mmetsp:Transcript_53693/g.136226  ORF Transcript_53693/g.136226 Transcript_53693/m.136226 type:complete len:203 (-) Transcript_53693:802-1410(-)
MIVPFGVQNVAAVQVPVDEVVAHHHLHAHVVKDAAKPSLHLALRLSQRRQRFVHGVLAPRHGFLASGLRIVDVLQNVGLRIVEVFQNGGDDLAIGPCLDQHRGRDEMMRHLREAYSALVLEVLAELLEVEGLAREVHLRLNDDIEFAAVERQGHVQEALREIDDLPNNIQIHEGAVHNTWMLHLHRHVPKLSARSVQGELGP